MTIEEQIETETKKLLAMIVEAANLADRSALPEEYYKIAQRILSQKSYMTGLETQAEQSFEARKLELRKEKELSIAAAENEAKTELCYKLYKNIKDAVESAEDEVMLLKKMLTARDTEYQQS